MLVNLFTFNFKKFILFFIKTFIFLMLIIFSMKFVGIKYSSTSKENVINLYNQKRFEEFYSLPKNSLDLVFLGSSHSYCTFDPEIFDNNLNISSYQLGLPLQHPDSTYYTLLEVLNYHTPKAVVMEVYWGVLENDFELNQIKTLFQVLRNKDLKDNFLKRFPLSEKIKYNNKIFNYQSDYFAFKNNEFKDKIKNKFSLKDMVLPKQEGVEEYRSKGYTFCNYKMLESEYDSTNQFKNFDAFNWNISKTQKKYLKEIIDICREKGIQLFLVTAPIANVSMQYIKNYDLIHNTIKEIAEENTLIYLDYNLINSEENLLTDNNFRDDAHLNDSGAKIVSNHFSNILKNYLN